MSVDGGGKLTPRKDKHTANTPDKNDRVPTMAILSPDGKFLLVGTTFDRLIARVGLYPDGSPILWVPEKDGTYRGIASNAPDPDGLVVFPVREDGTLGAAKLQDAKAGSPFYLVFLNKRPDTFVIGYAVGDGCALATIDKDGNINVGPLVKIDTSAGLPSELCWLALSPDDRLSSRQLVSYVTSFKLDGKGLEVAKDPARIRAMEPRADQHHGHERTSDNWLTPDGAFLYQLYGNAAKLVGYAAQPDGSLKEVTSAKIPYNSPQGLTGF
jgi:hypothetical protein